MAATKEDLLVLLAITVSITAISVLPRTTFCTLLDSSSSPAAAVINHGGGGDGDCVGQNVIKGMFVFGSSLVDNGNNNFLQNSLAKADFLPYGMDFPLGSTGRFTNGKNVVDLLCDFLKLPTYIPPFADPSTRGERILHGVNFASGGSGILDDTGKLAGQIFTLNQQINNFENVLIPELKRQIGEESSKETISKFLYVVGSGGNDYSFNYFPSKASSNVSLQDFTANLTSTLSRQLQRLYNIGARKFVLMAVNPNGCSPMAMAVNPPQRQGCVESVNLAVHLFNINLRITVDTIKKEMPGSHLVLVNSYKILRDIIRNPTSKGFTDARNPCCELGLTGILCKRGGKTCDNRNTNVFFDGLHPTEAVNLVIANKAFISTNGAEVYPMNVQMLSQISTSYYYYNNNKNHNN